MPKEKILIVDDSQDIIDGMKLFLELREYEVVSLTSIVALHQTIIDQKPALLILDIFLSGGDGRHICQQLKSNSRTQSLKIILTSASPQALTAYRNYGADAILEKPFGLEEIYSKVAQALRISPPL